MKRVYSLTLILLVVCLSFTGRTALAQHATAFDIENGGQAFQNYCANCHGPDGNLIADIDLGRGIFRRPLSDVDIVSIILNGIPDTPMPATASMSEEQAIRIVAYIRSLSENQTTEGLGGNAQRGKELFEGEGGCLECHRINGQGSRLGPDLSDIGRVRRAAELELSLLDPSAEVQATSRFYTVQTNNGESVTGRLLNHDTFTVQLLDEDERLRSFSKTDLQAFGFSDPEMPSLRDEFDEQQIADLIDYLISLRG